MCLVKILVRKDYISYIKSLRTDKAPEKELYVSFIVLVNAVLAIMNIAICALLSVKANVIFNVTYAAGVYFQFCFLNIEKPYDKIMRRLISRSILAIISYIIILCTTLFL